MDRKGIVKGTSSESVYDEVRNMHDLLDSAFLSQFQRSLPLADTLIDRWERARKLGFGDESSVYDSCYIYGNVKVGNGTWIGPLTIIDGSGGLHIGDNCTISAGVQIYTHDNIAQTLTGGQSPIDKQAVDIGHCTYLGPNSVITKGVCIGHHCIIGAGSFVNRNVPPNSVVVGIPGKIIGITKLNNGKLTIEYFGNQDSAQDK